MAWENLPNYTNKVHTDLELKFQKIFLKNIIKMGIKNLFIAGTCFEYGNIEGLLNEKAKIYPITEYGKAKNALRVYLEKLNKTYNFKYTWGRIFYLYGKYQSKKSLYNQLLKAIKMKKTFKMSSGKQIRDYLAIEEACKLILLLVKNNKNNKIVNICSNKKITIKDLVKKIIKSNNSKIKILYNQYSVPTYEPKNFWGCNKKLLRLTN